MKIFNKSVFTPAFIAGKTYFPGNSLTFIFKGTFKLFSGMEAKIEDKQIFPTGDSLYENDEGAQQGSCCYASDFAYFKPRTDLLLVGKCYPVNSKYVQACRVTFQVGNKAKSLAVMGNRYWKGVFNTISDPEPFTEMELRYENSYGGESYKKNPAGKGHKKENETEAWPLPNIENLQYRITSPNDHPEPAGFGPLGNMWQERYSKLGTYDEKWQKQRWPWFPEDFDWGYFNAAQPDMQVEGYLRGDEKLFFENLHPVHSNYHSQLPGLRVRLFVNELKSIDSSEIHFKEVTMNLDTLWVDMEAEKLVLVWRGLTEVLSEDYKEIQHVFIVSEKLEEPKQSVEYYHKLFLEKLAEDEADKSYEVKPLEAENVEDSTEVDEEIAKAEAQMRASLVDAGIDPDNLPEPTAEQKAEEAKILKEMGIEEEPEEIPLTREIFLKRVNLGETFVGEDLRVLTLSGLELQGVNLQSAIVSNVCLSNANLSSAMLAEANLVGADLSGANLREANLKEADLTGANLNGADLTGACLDDAIVEKAKLDGAILDEISAVDCNFSESNLTDARLINGKLQGADFSKAKLERANFQGANLFEASVAGAMGREVNMSQTNLEELRASESCDFSYGSFREAKGLESIWEGARLTGADFSYAHLEGADFTATNLEGANLYAANMKFSRFTKANLKAAKFIKMNLFQGSLEKADLTMADFSGSNLYGVEFLDTITDKTAFDLSNLKMTKLWRG